MGRRPIGQAAMSGAERQRHYLERLLKKNNQKPEGLDAQSQQELARAQGELAAARTRIAELEKALLFHKDELIQLRKILKHGERGTLKVIELRDRKIVKLELTPKEFKILQRAINPECRETEETNAARMFIQSLKQRYSSMKEISQL